jgi:anti-sigma regulatory factor (Ser/Thr protein kinase)
MHVTSACVEIIDSGSPFDPLEVPQPADRGGADIRVGGVGVALVRGFADECSYERRGAQNVFQFTIKPGQTTAS